MTNPPITQEELSRLARTHASTVIAAGIDTDQALEINARLLKEFQLTWQPSFSDKQYTALFNTYTNWVLAEIKNHCSPGMATKIDMIAPESIPDGTEIYRPNRDPMPSNKWLALVRKTHETAESSAKTIAAVTKSGGDGRQEIAHQFDAFLRLITTKDPPNDEEMDEIVKIYYAQTEVALGRELNLQAATTSPTKASGCFGVVALFVLTPLVLLVSWSYA